MTNNSMHNQLVVRPDKYDNKESTTLIWFDSNMELQNDIEQIKLKLRLINNTVIIMTNLNQCIKFIQSIDKENIFLIISGVNVSQILSQTSSCHQIHSILIFCTKEDRQEHLLNTYPKIIGIYVEFDDLCQSIQEQIHLFYRQILTLSYFSSHERLKTNLSKESAAFLWFQLLNHVILRLPEDEKAKQQMIEFCKKYYDGNETEMKWIQNFEKNYRSKDAILWYSRRCFIYKLINKALCTRDFRILYTFKYFLADLSRNIRNIQQHMLVSKEKILVVYRGVQLDKQEFEKLKNHQGHIISTNGFLFTNRRKSRALRFTMKPTNQNDIVSVLFHIRCNVEQIDKNIIFANITQLTEYHDNEEVLFGLNTCFLIQSIEEQDSLQIVKLKVSNEGEKFTRNYIQFTQNEIEEPSISIVFGRLYFYLEEYDISLRYFKQLLNNSHDEDQAWIEFNIGRSFAFKSEWNKTRKYYELAYDKMMKDKLVRIKDSAWILHNMGSTFYHEGKYQYALNYHQRSLKILEKCYPSGHINIAKILRDIGHILYIQEKFNEALGYDRQALKMYKNYFPSDHEDIAKIYYSIGNILDQQGNPDEALHYYQSALEMFDKLKISDHIDVGEILRNIGDILSQQANFDDALNFYQRALKIFVECHPSTPIHIAKSQNNIGAILDRQGKYSEALTYHQQALKIFEKLYPSNLIDITTSLSNIGNIFYQQKQYDEALDYYKRALKIFNQFYPSGHVDMAATFNNIGAVRYVIGEYDKALEYYRKAYATLEQFNLSDHANIAASLGNIGLILTTQEKYDEALNYYEKALNIFTKHYPSGHFHVALSLNNIGASHADQNKHDLALEYYQRSLDMYKKCLITEYAECHKTEQNILRITRKH